MSFLCVVLADVAPNAWLAEKFTASVLASLRKQV